MFSVDFPRPDYMSQGVALFASCDLFQLLPSSFYPCYYHAWDFRACVSGLEHWTPFILHSHPLSCRRFPVPNPSVQNCRTKYKIYTCELNVVQTFWVFCVTNYFQKRQHIFWNSSLSAVKISVILPNLLSVISLQYIKTVVRIEIALNNNRNCFAIETSFANRGGHFSPCMVALNRAVADGSSSESFVSCTRFERP